MPQVKDWALFGWQGITLDVPLDWEIRRFHGTRSKGYARLEDGDDVRLEMRWDKSKGRGPSFTDLTDRHISGMMKKDKVDVERHTGLAKPEGKEVETYTVRPPETSLPPSYQMISRCPECSRIVMIRIPYQRGENIKAIVRRIFSSLQDHSYDGADVWSVYGLRFAVPDTVELDDALLYPGSIEFSFLKGHDRIELGRLAFGSVILERQTLEEWFEVFSKKRFKRMTYEARPQEIRGHQGLIAHGRLKRFGAMLLRFARRQRFLCDLWHCPVSDKLYYYAVLAGSRNHDNFVAHSARVICHPT